MGRRPNLASVDLISKPEPPDKDSGEPGRKAGTLRMKPEIWENLRIMAAIRGTSQFRLAEQAIEEWLQRNAPAELAKLKAR